MARKGSQVNVSVLQEEGQQTSSKKSRAEYDRREKEILLELVKEALESSGSSNDKKHAIWKAVTLHFNTATSRNETSQDVRKLYGRLKIAAKQRHDRNASSMQAFKKSCKQTGGGMGMAMPSDVSGDDYEDHFAGDMDPPGDRFNSFNGPNSSKEVFSLLPPNGCQGDTLVEVEADQVPIDVLQMATQEIPSDGISTETVITIETPPAARDSEDIITLHQMNDNQLETEEVDNSNKRKRNSSAPSVTRTEKISAVRSKAATKAPSSSRAPNKKDAAATTFYEETLKQRKRIGRYQLADAKHKLNINYMKSRLLEAQLQNNGISFQLPCTIVDISSSESDTEEEEG